MDSQKDATKNLGSSRCSSCGLEVGPLNAERWTLDELLVELNKWKDQASGKTCVSFECLCFGASSLWHQTHRENFRAIDRKPEALSRWVLQNQGSVKQDFPLQVLELLVSLDRKNKILSDAINSAIVLANGRDEEWGTRAQRCFKMLLEAVGT